MSDYSKKLLDPRWQRKKNSILERDNYSCKKCRDNTSTLHVHHIIYKFGHEPWEYSEDELDTLCENCHKKVSRQTKEYFDNIKIRIYKLGIENASFLLSIFEDLPPNDCAAIIDYLVNGDGIEKACVYRDEEQRLIEVFYKNK